MPEEIKAALENLGESIPKRYEIEDWVNQCLEERIGKAKEQLEQQMKVKIEQIQDVVYSWSARAGWPATTVVRGDRENLERH